MPRKKPAAVYPFTPSPLMKVVDPTRCIPTGITLLNLACSGHPRGGFLAGGMVNMIGDSSAGKSLALLTTLAASLQVPHLNGYRRILDEPEASNEFDMAAMFGTGLVEALEPPREDRLWSENVEEFYYSADAAIKGSAPCIYGLDSMDSLESLASAALFEKNRAKVARGNAPDASYGDGKAKINSENLRKLCRGLKSSGSFLYIVSQTRDNIGIGFAPKTRAGGRALKFYATYEIWLAVEKAIKREVRGKPRLVGQRIKLKLSKNKATGTYDIVSFPIRYGYGIDDTMSCIDYLLEEGEWKTTGGVVRAKGILPQEEKGLCREDLAGYLENEGKLESLQNLVGTVWHSIKGVMLETGRRGRFS